MGESQQGVRVPKDFESYCNELRLHTDCYHLTQDDEMTVKVSNNLLARHAQLLWIEELTRKHLVHDKLSEKYTQNQIPSGSGRGGNELQNNHHKSCDNKSCENTTDQLHPEERVYRLAATDLFVEKAQAFLEVRAESYRRSGKIARRIASAIVLAGAGLALFQMFHFEGCYSRSWLELASVFSRAFTSYGMIVLAAVGFNRYSRSMLDQAERLFERRHALRQGRLFVHLKCGIINIDEMERAFNWNVSKENAFANINTEASAPWGVVFKEFAKSAPEIFKAGMQSMEKGKDKSTN